MNPNTFKNKLFKH